MNDIKFNVEKPNVGLSHAPIIGEWRAVMYGPQGQITYKLIESSEIFGSSHFS